MKAKLDHIVHEDQTKMIISFWFETDKTLDHIAGQFIEMTIHHPNADDRGDKRWFTISSSPTDAPLMSITTKFASTSSSFKQALHDLKKGDEVTISSPMGDFVLPKDDSIPLIFVSGGIGITPYHSIIKWLSDTKQSRDIKLIYAANNIGEMVFLETFRGYGLNLQLILNDPPSNWDGQTGYLSGQMIIDRARPTSDSLIFISGPETMVESLQSQLKTLAIEEARLVGDFFPGYSSL